jgi:hypothetical protein
MIKISCSALHINNPKELYREFKVAYNKAEEHEKVE